jgi:D-alanyl-D-alanine carboxypeptidase/D-alanyl-D-alanine-endopeptidase (penicillin-binding protein 4)
MDPRARRRATAAAAGLAGFLAALLGGLALVLRPEPADAAAPAGPAASEAPERTVELNARLGARVRALIAEYEERASKESGGRVSAKDVAVSVHVREAGAKGELVAIEADRAMRPASNLKLVTSSAALVLLGAGWSFETILETEGAIENGVLRGDLVVRAGGDPLYDRDPEAKGREVRGDGSVDALLAPALASLEKRGLKSVDGALVLDELDYAAPSPAPAWPSESQRWSEYCALAGGFSANAGCLTATVKPGEVGGPAEVRVEPRHDGLERKGRVTTGPAKSKLDVRVEARAGAALVEGSIPKSVPTWSTRFAAPDPVDLFGHALAGALADRGIAVKAGWKRAHAPMTGKWTQLARISTPLTAVVDAMNTDSNNACADQVFLALGHARGGGGTREGGRAAVAKALEKLGVTTDGLVQVDGSGLSRDDRVSARQITALVDAVLRLDEKTSRTFVESLALASESGTLDDRMRDPKLAGKVRAKTGFIAGTSALSGLLETKDGRRLVFSILVEYPNADGLNRSCWKPMEDAICAELAGADG